MKIFSLLFFAVLYFPVQPQLFSIEPDMNAFVTEAPVPVYLSEDGALLLVTGPSFDGLSLVETATGETRTVTEGRNAGYYPNISPDGRFIAYKGFKSENGRLLQAAMLYEIETAVHHQLSGWSEVCGTPAVAPDGSIAYTADNDLVILNADRTVRAKYTLDGHVNLLRFSPDSNTLAYNPVPDTLAVLDLSAGKKEILMEGAADLYNPVFSPNGGRLIVQGINGAILLVDISDPVPENLGSGNNPAWIDERTVAFIEFDIEELEIIGTNLVVMDTKTRARQKYALGNKYIPAVVSRNSALYQEKENLYQRIIEKGIPISPRKIPLDKIEFPGYFLKSFSHEAPRIIPRSTTEIDGVPYIHQVYDTPLAFNGHAACGATSALMAIQYYELLPARAPSGWYVSNIYTYNGVTYDIWAHDPSRNVAYGGYGYIIQDTGWYGGPNRGNEHTSVWMSRYFINHGFGSSVDLSTTWSKLTNEINSEDPFVVLFSNRLTGGHYITATGYVNGQYTAIFNDPYGNQNTSRWPSHDGLRVFYDWPGYNHGNENLQTVHRFVYARGDFRPPSEEYSPEDWVSTTATSLNFRDAPGTDTNVIRTLPRGTIARILEHDNKGIFRTGYYWWYVRIHETGETGWVVENFIENTSSPCSVSTPNQPDGPAGGAVNDSLSFSTGGASCACGANVEYRFDWNDGSYSNWSTLSSASHSWSSGGIYELRARARCLDNLSRESDWSSGRTVQIYEPPSAFFAADKTVVEPDEIISFTDYSTGDITEWSWNFGDGTTSSTANTSHSYSELGSYTVSLEVHGPAGSDTISREKYIHVLETVKEYDARIYSYTIPTIMKVNHPYNFQLTLRNIGSQPWDEGGHVCLGAAGDQDELTTSEYYRIGLTSTVNPGTLHTFHIPLLPEETGTFTTEWRMLKEGQFWFGETFSKEVRVDDRTRIENSTWSLFE